MAKAGHHHQMLPCCPPNFFLLAELRLSPGLPWAPGHVRPQLCRLADDDESLRHEKAGHDVCGEEAASSAGLSAPGIFHVSQCPSAGSQVGVVMYGVRSLTTNLCVLL